MHEIEVMQCYACGNHNGNHFRRLKTGYICDHCNTYHYYRTDDEQTRCMNGYKDIRDYHFSNAEAEFSDILRDYPESVAARWGILLARFGVVAIRGFYEKTVFEDGTRTFAVKPIYCFQHYDKWKHKTFRTEKEYIELEELLKDEPEAWKVCAKRAEEIDRALLHFKDSKRCAERDIFICVKISKTTEANPDATGKTDDFEEAKKLYRELSDRGMNVFFSYQTLHGGLIHSDDQIWTHLLKSKKMLLIVSKEEYLKSPWVKSEWNRWLYLGREESLYIYSLADNPYEILPKELAELGQNIYDSDRREQLIEDICDEKNIAMPSPPPPPPPPPPKKQNPKWLAIFLSVLLLLGIAGGIYAFRDHLFSSENLWIPSLKCFFSGHDAVTDYGTAATCTETGLTNGEHCSICQTVIKEQEVIPAAHTIVIDAAKAATCTENGLTEGQHCSVCQKVLLRQEVIPASHTIVTDAAKAATCTEDGLTAGQSCSVCKEIFVKQSVIQAKGHTVVKLSAKDATCTESGLTAGEHCSVCQMVLKKQEVIPMKAHTVVTYEAKEPTCTESGTTEGKGCSVCKTILVTPTTLAATGHHYENQKCVFCNDRQPTDESYFIFTLLNDGTYSIKAKDVSKIPQYVKIPSSYNGKAVTIIDYDAFRSCDNLQSIEIPDGMTDIAASAFYECKNLHSITIPDSVIKIGDYAFYECDNLQNIEIPDSVTSIGDSAFQECERLANINGMIIVKNILFGYCGQADQIIIPDSVTRISNFAFARCNSQRIEIPDSVMSIGDYAFCECKNLQSIKIGNSVTSIGIGVFEMCTNLKIVDIPDSVTSIGAYMFYNCENLQSIDIPDSVTNIGEAAFQYCFRLQDVMIPDSVTSIGNMAFWDCDSFHTITIPDSVINIGDGAFTGLDKLQHIVVEKGNPVYHSEGDCLIFTKEKKLLLGCLNSIIPTDGSVEHIVKSAFEECKSIMEIPDGVMTIDDFAFLACNNLQSITIPQSMQSIGFDVFFHCEKLQTIVFKGTRAEWNAISIGRYNLGLGKDLTIQCTDGTISYKNP